MLEKRKLQILYRRISNGEWVSNDRGLDWKEKNWPSSGSHNNKDGVNNLGWRFFLGNKCNNEVVSFRISMHANKVMATPGMNLKIAGPSLLAWTSKFFNIPSFCSESDLYDG